MKAILNLFKLRIGVTIALTALAGLMVSPGSVGPWQGAALVLAVFLSSAAAGAFNQYWEVDLDQHMARTRSRPFVTGKMRHHGGWLALIVGLCGLAVAAAWLATNATAAAFTFLGAFVYAIVYTVWLKRRTAWNIVVGGLAGSFAVLAGAAAVEPGLSREAMLLAVILFLWTPPHFWSLSIAFGDDYRATGVPMLPVVTGDQFAAYAILGHSIVLVALALAMAFLAPGWLYLVCATVGGWLLLSRSVRVARAPSRATAMACFHASLIQLGLLLLGVIADAVLRNATGL